MTTRVVSDAANAPVPVVTTLGPRFISASAVIIHVGARALHLVAPRTTNEAAAAAALIAGIN